MRRTIQKNQLKFHRDKAIEFEGFSRDLLKIILACNTVFNEFGPQYLDGASEQAQEQLGNIIKVFKDITKKVSGDKDEQPAQEG